MPYILYLGVPLALLALFLLLVAVEERRGSRLVLAGRRYRLDQQVARAAFVAKHVDWGAFLNDIVRTSLERLAHDLAHTTLLIVRALERQLTGLVRTLRARREQPLLPRRAPDAPSRFEQATAYLRKSVQRSRRLPTPEEGGE